MFMFDICKEDREKGLIVSGRQVWRKGLVSHFRKLFLGIVECLEFTRLKDCGSVVPVPPCGPTIPRPR